ncbi:MAG: hypothetical protein Q9223_005667, partial [Gallowayella weberi]
PKRLFIKPIILIIRKQTPTPLPPTPAGKSIEPTTQHAREPRGSRASRSTRSPAAGTKIRGSAR